MSDVIEIEAEVNESVGGTGGVAGYHYLPDKPSINGVTLVDNKSAASLGLVDDVQQDGESVVDGSVANLTPFSGGSTSSASNKAGLVPKPPTIEETGQWHILTDNGWKEATPQPDSSIPWATKYSPTFSGIPKAPTAAVGTNTTQIATTAFVHDEILEVPKVYCGEEAPEDPNAMVWVDTNGDPYPMEEEIADAVDEWVTAHPEAITTVQDGAITVPKFAAGVVDAALNKSGYPADSKATGDAITADRTRLTAVEGEADALDARITSLATLTEGSTTGDAELIDARTVGSTTYSSLHQAIDTEFSNVKSALSDTNDAVFNIDNISGTLVSSMGYYQGYLVSTTGWSDGDKYSVRYYPIESGETYSIESRIGYWYAFSNYTPSQGLSMENKATVASAVFNFTNTNNYKYIYICNTMPPTTTELPNVVVQKTSRFSQQKSNFIVKQTRIIVAASNAPSSNKAIADYVCDGTNDEVEIQAALNKITDLTGGEVLLTAGDFYIDSFSTVNGKKIALCLSNGSYNWQKAIIGAGNYPLDYGRTKITVTATALASLGSDVGYVFGTASFVYGRIGIFKNFNLYLADNQHKVTVIDNTQLAAGICEKVAVHGVLQNIANTSNTPMPDEDCIGITGYCGDDNGTLNIMKNCFATGFYEGFRLGGEHLICEQLVARYNYYSYTFGNYDWHTGTQSHPITLINCCDEHSAKLPKFVRNGNYDANDHKAMQEVDLIGFNLELFAPDNFGGGLVAPAQEAVADSFCGRIEFAGYGTSNVDADLTEYPITTNQKRIKFWADGSGRNFRTHNMVHKIGGTTSERLNYTPTYMQEYYDTDLNKMLVYNGSAWVDMNGNIV